MLTLTIPSKTFLLGEYAVLDKGMALIATTHPNFILNFTKSDRLSCEGFNLESPTGKFMHDNRHVFDNVHYEFLDPYFGRGGFGGSSAQFLGAYFFLMTRLNKKFSVADLLDSYWEYHFRQGYRPSGADICAQFTGNITCFDSRELSCHEYHWPFDDLSFFIIKTNLKIPTHLHLEQLKSFESTQLKTIFDKSLCALKSANREAWLNAINDYQNELIRLKFCDNQTKQLIERLWQVPGILATKGCGALGADVLLVITDKPHRQRVVDYCVSQKITIIAETYHLSDGLQIIS